MFICLPPGHPRCRLLCFFSRTQSKIFLTQTVAVSQSYNGSQWDPRLCSWRYIEVLRHETISLCKKLSSIYIIFYLWSTAMSNCPECVLWHSRRKRSVTCIRHSLFRSLPRMRLLCQRTLTRHAPAVVNALRTVGHCGGSEVKNYRNTVQFLAQTDCFVS